MSRGGSKCKHPEAGASLKCSRNSEEAGVAGEKLRGEVPGRGSAKAKDPAGHRLFFFFFLSWKVWDSEK